MRLTAATPPEADWLGADRVPQASALALLVSALLLIFWVDRATDAAPVQHLYYLPIIFAALRFRMRGGLALACSAIVLYHAANPHLISFRYEETDLVQIVLFAAVGVVSAKLAGDARRLRHLAMTDDLTGLHNLRSFEPGFGTMVRAARETNTPLSVLVLDLDNLKSLNDAHGHLAGAEAVRTVGRLIGARIPERAIACRYGGDEFVIAIPDCHRTQALEIAAALCLAVKELSPRLANLQFPAGRLSISVGVAGGRANRDGPSDEPVTDDEQGEALFRAADAALYAAKRSGRNRVSEEGAEPSGRPLGSPADGHVAHRAV